MSPRPAAFCELRVDTALSPKVAPALSPRACVVCYLDEKIENLGRGAVVRLVGSLGMGRYAHRFRAFAVTGSDLVSCTEEDLIQIGISFRCDRWS